MGRRPLHGHREQVFFRASEEFIALLDKFTADVNTRFAQGFKTGNPVFDYMPHTRSSIIRLLLEVALSEVCPGSPKYDARAADKFVTHMSP